MTRRRRRKSKNARPESGPLREELSRLTLPLRVAPCQLNSPAGPRSPDVESLCGSAFVSMVKPADFRHGDNPAQFRRFNRSSIWTVLPKRKMTPRAVILVQVAGDLPSQRGLVHDNHMIQTFAANRTDYSFDIWVLPGRSGSREHFRDLHFRLQGPESLAIDSIPVPKYVARRRVPRECLHQLRRRPLRSRMFGHVEMHHPSAFMSQNEEHIQVRKGTVNFTN